MASGYLKPVQGTVKRLDQGIDFQANPGDPVVAIGLARVDAVKADPGGFGKAIYYTLLSGPMRGQQIYVGHAQPTVTQGQIITAGGQVATLLAHGLGNAQNLSGWVEIGFAKNGAPQPGSSGRFQKFIKNLPYQPSSPPPVQSSSIGLPAPDAATEATLAGVSPPAPASTQPFVMPPGSGGDSVWRQIAAQSGLSPATQMYAQNALTAGG